MKALRFITMVATVLLFQAAASAQNWVEYRPGVGFRVEMPRQWAASSQDLQTQIGPLKLYMATVDDKTKVYMSMYNAFPKEHIARTPAETLLDNARNGAVQNVKGKLLYEDRITMGGSPGRHIVVDAAAGRISQRFVLSGNNLFQVIFVGPVGAESEPDTVRFFRSFALTAQ